jgi:PAS domain S-box-containing protein
MVVRTDNPTAQVGVLSDPQSQQKMARALRKSEERFRQVVESAPYAMVMISQAGTIEMVNAQAESVFGFRREEMLGQPIDMLVPERFRGHHPNLRSSFFSRPASRPMGAGRDLYGLRKDGSEFPVEIGLNPIETDEGTMVLSAIVDISDRRHKEESIQAALEEKDVLLGEIHHRVKNNLQIVHSLLDLQAGNITDIVALGLIGESQNRIRSMALIHQTLYESKNFTHVNFGSFLDALVPTLVSTYAVGSPRFKLAIDEQEVLLPINAAAPCGLIMNELISNALKHAFPHDREGTIKIHLASENGDHVLLSVRDDGVGIPEDVDVEGATTLGLQLVTLLVEQLAGELEIQRANPTLFSVRFPLRRA